MEINEDYVSSETAKLLKEKGFDEKCFGFYDPPLQKIQYRNGIKNSDFEDTEIAAPTQALVLKWLRVKHNIHIEIHHWTNQPVGDEMWKDCYQGFVDGDAMNVSIFKTHEECSEKTIRYCLEHIIK